MLTFKQLIDLNNAYIEFCEYEYGQAEALVDFSQPVQTISREVLLQMIDIAYTDEVEDSFGRFRYEVAAKVDILNCEELYQLSNEKLTVICVKETSVDEIIYNLRSCSFDDWMTCTNWIDYDEVTQLTDGVIGEENLFALHPEMKRIEIVRLASFI
ncbi:MAG: hypothetical protein PWP69_34 [Enterococcus sp.]|uniref:hypothetical protein n=1 Tax=Enterococcus sp. TaxID=35783 RepID=UPI0025832AB7|nr:hypothetical protein [Enterococcus sp.]MDK2843242.1 hypothetical protein [Enterococcus sp.]